MVTESGKVAKTDSNLEKNFKHKSNFRKTKFTFLGPQAKRGRAPNALILQTFFY